LILEYLKFLRINYWSKNFLLFLPLILSHQYTNNLYFIELSLCFLSFGVCASALYIVNDIFDLKNDKKHSFKKNRLLASGKIQISTSIILSTFLLIAGLSVNYYFIKSDQFLFYLILYLSISFFYSYILKKIYFLDCIVLSLLYIIRIVCGAKVIYAEISFWLISFSFFFFLSLAFLKRLTEMNAEKNLKHLKYRGYLQSDKFLIEIIMVITSYISILLLSLYMNSPEVVKYYNNPEYLWLIIVLLFYWLNQIIFQVFRKKIKNDPVTYVLTNKLSYFVLILIIIVYFLSV